MYLTSNFQEFQEDLRAELNAEMPEGHVLEEKEIVKNGIVKHALSVVREEDYGTVGVPTMYYEDLFEWYVEQEDAEAAIRSLVVHVLTETRKKDPNAGEIIEKMLDKEYVLNHVRYRFARAGSENMYEDSAMKMWQDIPVLFYCTFRKEGYEASVRVTKALAVQLGLSFEDLDAAAARNSQDSDAYITPLAEKMGIQDELGESGFLFFYGTDRCGDYAAADILVSDKVKDFAWDIGMDIYLIPSSVHEWLIFPDNSDVDVAYLNTLVRNINETTVNPEERLSDHVYYLNRLTGEISIPPEC